MVRLVVVALQWVIRHAVVLLLVMSVLLVGRWALAGMRQLAQARSEAVALQGQRAAWQNEPARVAGWIDSLLAGGSSAVSGADTALRSRLAGERARREAERAALAAGNPIALRLPGSDAFLAAARLDLEIGALRQAEAHLQAQTSLAQALGNAQAARATLFAERSQTQSAIDARLARRRALWTDHTFLREIPGTAVYREIDRLDIERHALEVQRVRTDASIQRLDESARLGREWQRGFRAAPAALHALAAPIAAQIDARSVELERRIGDNLWRRTTEEFGSVFVPALLILAGSILSGPLIKTFAYFVLAPLAAGRPPIRLLASEAGELRATAEPTPGGKVSGSTLRLVLAEGEELRVHADYLQSRPATTRASTELWLDPTRPFTSLAAGMALVQRVLPDNGLPLLLSSTRQDLIELALLDLPAGSAFVLRPRGLAAVVQRVDRPLRITSHWRFASLHAWLDLQFRYLVFHGPVRLVLKGARGVIVEASATRQPPMDRVVNQAGVLGWSAGLARSSTRCDSFPAYLLGQQDLLNDRFHGAGSVAYEEMPGASASHSLAFGKGFTGLADSVLKVFGI